jgi:hypothetical protein
MRRSKILSYVTFVGLLASASPIWVQTPSDLQQAPAVKQCTLLHQPLAPRSSFHLIRWLSCHGSRHSPMAPSET